MRRCGRCATRSRAPPTARSTRDLGAEDAAAVEDAVGQMLAAARRRGTAAGTGASDSAALDGQERVPVLVAEEEHRRHGAAHAHHVVDVHALLPQVCMV